MIILYQNVGDTVVITQVKPVWTLGKEKLFLAGNTSEIKVIEKHYTSSNIRSPKKEKITVKNLENEKTANIEIKNQSTQDTYQFSRNLKTTESTLGTGMITRDNNNNNNNIISQIKDPFICLRNGISNTTDLDSNPFITKTSSSSSILSPEKKHIQLQNKLEDDDIEVKKEITFLFTIVGWQDTTTGIGKKYEKITEEKINIDNVEVEVDVDVEVEKKSKRKSFVNNNFKTILNRSSTDKKITRLSCIRQEKYIESIKKKENIISISNISIIEIHGVNEDTKMSILFEYRIYTVLLPYLLNDWLEPGKEIEVYYGLITEIDKSYDFIRILRSEHTIVKEKCNTIYNEQLSSAISTKNRNYNVNNNNTPYNKKNNKNNINKNTSYKNKNNDNNNNHDNKENNRENYNKKIEGSDMNENKTKNDNNDASNKNDTSTKIAQNVNCNKNKIENNDNNIPEFTIIQQRMFRNNILENDRNRYDALGQNKTEFQNVSNNTIETCLRHRINNAYVLIKRDTNKLNQNLEPAENKCQDSLSKRTDHTGTDDAAISGTSGYESIIKEVPKEDCKEYSMGSMMTCESDEALLHESEEQQQQQQQQQWQQQQQRNIQSVPQLNSKKRLLDSSIPCDHNILLDSTESYRPYRQEFVTLTVSKDNKAEIMEIEHSLLPEELQYDFQEVGKNANNNEDNHVNGYRMYDIVFARTWTPSSSMSSSSEDNVKTNNPSSYVHSTVISTPALDPYKTNRESLTSASSEEQNFNKKECSIPKCKVIWMKQKL